MDFSYTAIVLGKREIGETDRLYTFLTREAGKIRAMGRGSRKPVAKLAGHLETLSLIDLSIARSRGRGNISSAVTENAFPNIRQSERLLRMALESVSMVDRLVGEDESDEELFLLLLEFLSSLDMLSAESGVLTSGEYVHSEDILRLGFLWKFLSHIGFGIEANRCVVEGEALRAGERYAFSSDMGGIVCDAHRMLAKQTTSLDEDAVKLLRVLLSNRIASLRKLSVSQKTERLVSNALQSFIWWVSH